MHGDVEQERLYQNCEIYNPQGSCFAPGEGKHDIYTILNEILINIHTELKTRLSSVASIAMIAEKEASVTLST
jgi:hypothetical protein